MWEFKFYSRGGQGAVTAAKLLVNAAIMEGKFAQAIPSYGQERKGAPVYTFARVNNESIELKSYVYSPNCIVVFDMGLEELGINIYEGIKPGCLIVANTLNNLTTDNKNIEKVVTIDAEGLTNQINEGIPFNSAMLGALARGTGCVSIGSLEAVIKSKISGKAGEQNAKACRRAYEEAAIYEKV